MLEKRIGRQSDEMQDVNSLFKHVAIGASGSTTVLSVHEKNSIFKISSTYTHTVQLPPVGACVGQIFAIQAQDAGGGLTITAPDSLGWPSTSLGTDNDYAVVMSNGFSWLILVAN